MDPDAPVTDPPLGRELEEARAEIATLRAERDAARREETTRVRNLLATIRSVFRRTVGTATSLEDVELHFAGRFDALVRFGKGTAGGRGSELEDVLRDELLVAGESDRSGIRLEGPPAWLTARQAPLIGLAIHELVTNAIKYGALATDDGQLAVTWAVEEGEAGGRLHLVWAETNVPVLASAPMPHGFGREFIEQALPYQLRAETLFELRPGGVRCEIWLPLGG